ncbi:MAG: hypothetical protein ASARMPRED_009263, partial [Alectoria sarmentosa]
MAFQPSPWIEINGGDADTDQGLGERSKRLCTGLGNASEPWSPVQTPSAGSQTLPEQSPYDVSRYDLNCSLDVRGWPALAVDDDVSRQHVGSVQGQSLFKSHQNLLWPSSDYNPRPSRPEVVYTTPSSCYPVSNVQAPPYPALNEYESWNPPPISNIPHEGNPHGQYHQSDVGTISQHGYQGSVSDGASKTRKSADTGYEDTSYELCLGLINTATLRVSKATLETIPTGKSGVKLQILGPVTTVHSVQKQSNSDYMGLLDHETASALGQILRACNFDIRAYILHDSQSYYKNKSAVWGASIPIHIVVYGHLEDFELAGHTLSESNFFLQHPQYKEDLAVYKNPQYLIRPGEEYPKIDCIDADPSSLSTESSNEREALSDDRLKSIFESAQGPETYSIVEPSPRLSTPLQPHQRMGLAMMHEKESGNLQKNEFTALWSQTSSSNGRSWAKQSCDEDQPLLANHWLRVVLDEAHVIRNASTKQCATVCALKARHRWCLTGTPIQNAIEDFGSLLQFLQVYPFDNPSSFTHEIADWIRCGDEKGMKRLRLLVSAICLRRTKDCLGLPPRKNEIQPVAFNNEEKDLYEICKQSTVEFIELVFKEDGKLKSFATVIQLILRLRQICNHGKEMLSAKALKNIDDYMSSQGSRGSMSRLVEVALCGICGRKVQDMEALLPCMHPTCSFCFEEKEMMLSKGELDCSICAGTLSSKSNNNLGSDQDQPIPDAIIVAYKPSSKVATLIKNLLSYNQDPTTLPIKSVVFSYWTKMLDLISQALNANNIRFERLDGKMSTPQRHRAIQNFRKDPRCTVFLATVGSAGVGIDLTAACRIHLMEPQWNPMAEEQALDRVHRIGQTQPVIATRYIYVVSLQRTKLDLIQQSLGPSAAPKPNALKERLKVRSLRSSCTVIPPADDSKNLHDFLTSSSTAAGDS